MQHSAPRGTRKTLTKAGFWVEPEIGASTKAKYGIGRITVADGRNPEAPNIYYTATFLLYKVTQDLYYQQYPSRTQSPDLRLPVNFVD